MAKFRARQGVNMSRVISKIVVTVFSLYVGGTILTEVGGVMNNTQSAFYKGLSLIGWTVSDAGLITDTSGSGILVVVGLVAIASIVMEFVEFKL